MKTLKTLSMLFCLMALAVVSVAQDRARMTSSHSDKKILVRKTTDPTYIPSGSKVYVANIDGMPDFENNLVAAFQKKRVDLFVVTDRSQANFEVNGFARSKDAGWAKIIFGSGLPESEASIQVVNIQTGVVAYAVASYKVSSPNGNKSTAEHLAKNLRQKMERDDRRIK
jgi:3D (Asp-Asp-Asp) domain-containing protein